MAITSLQPPVYNKFLDASYEIADKVEMIHTGTVFVQCWLNAEGME